MGGALLLATSSTIESIKQQVVIDHTLPIETEAFCMKELRTAMNRMKKGGAVVLHDVPLEL